MDNIISESLLRPNWRKVAYGGMQPGFDDNHTDESFLEDMVMNANVVKRDILKVMQDSVSISQYLCIVTLVSLVWAHTLQSTLDENSLLLLDASLFGSGFLVLLLTKEMRSLNLLFHYILNISFFHNWVIHVGSYLSPSHKVHKLGLHLGSYCYTCHTSSLPA